MIPGALSGIGTGVILGMARAMGETMVVLMVAGGAPQIPDSLFDSVRPLPATIAAEMGETPYGTDHYAALFAIGIVLFLITLGFNLVAATSASVFSRKGQPRYEPKTRSSIASSRNRSPSGCSGWPC
jgi:phosphate transport system permease protein